MKSLSIILFSFLSLTLSGQAALPFADNFNDGSFNANWWTLRPNLQGTSGIIEITNQIGINNSFGVRMGKSSDGQTFTTNALDLHLDLSGETDVELTFWIADYYDEDQVGDGLYFSDNGGASFAKVLDFFPEEWCDNTYGRFPPIDMDELAAKAGLGLTSQFVVRFQQTGTSDFTGGSTDGFYLDDVRVYDPQLEYATLPFQDGFENGNFSNNWAWNFADETVSIAFDNAITSPMNIVEVSSAIGRNSTFAARLGKRCDGPFTTNALDLHLNLSGETDVEMTFWIADYYDEDQVDDGLYFSDDGGISFVKVLDFFPEEWCDNTYGQFPPIDVDGLAAKAGLGLTSQFVVRFQQTGTGDFTGGSTDGFYLDDLKVYDPGLEYATIPFEDGFESGSLGKHWAWNFADETVSIATENAVTSPMNQVGVFDQIGFDGSAGVFMGRICDGPFTTNALDLHLNLSGETNVEMTFNIADYVDETQVDEGLYFSDDGGQNFEKVLDFLPTEWCDNIFGRFPPIDIDKLAAQAGLSLTDQFVVRFQQTGQGDLSGGTTDGFYLDRVKVYASELEYASLPFVDDFETGNFKKAWAWKKADATTTIATDAAITSPMNEVGVYNFFGNNSTYSALVGRLCNGPFTTNALDLHLNLQGQSDVDMTFWLANNYDETQEDDGIYFSDDSGQTFEKVFSFDFSNTPSNVYQSYSLDIDALVAASNALSMSDRFVIRFQQHGQGGFFNSGDGFYLDDVAVTGMVSAVSDSELWQAVSIAPNPSSDVIRIETQDLTEGIDLVQVFDNTGQKITSRKPDNPNGLQLNIADLPGGLYFVRIMFDTGEQISKRIIKR